MTEHLFPIAIRHERHGSTHVYTNTELAERLKQGWAREDEPVQVQEEPRLSVVSIVDEQARRKPGRPRKVA